MIEQKDVTIIIPHYGATKEQCNALIDCYKSLQETAPASPIIIIKNGDIPCTCPRTVRVLLQGQCKAVNAGIAISNTPWIFITNDDMIYPPQWFENLTNNVDSENFLCISPKLIEPRDGAPTFEKYFCGGAGGDFDKAKFLEFAKEYELRSEEEKKFRTGFNFPVLLDRVLWNFVEAYDIDYDPWGSNGDSDLEYKIRLAGVQPMQNQRAIVYHFSQTSGTFESKNDSYRMRNYAYFKEKWGFDRTDNGIWEANFEMPTIEQGRIFKPWWEGLYQNNIPQIKKKI